MRLIERILVKAVLWAVIPFVCLGFLAWGVSIASAQGNNSENGGQPAGETAPPVEEQNKRDRTEDKPQPEPDQQVGQSSKAVPEQQAKQQPGPPRQEKSPGTSKGGETIEVEKQEVEILLEVDGVLGARQDHEIRVATERWNDLRVLEAVPHGSVVRKGDSLVRFDTRLLEEAIVDAERELPAREQALLLARAELQRLRATEAGDLAKARRTCRETKVDYDYYQATARPRKLLEEAQKLKRATEMLEYEEEELRQLLMMYEADDLTEETEEIIIKRQRNAVEYAGNMLERAQVAHDLLVGTTIAREDRTEEIKRERADVELALAEVTIPNARRAKQHEVIAAEQTLEKKRRALAELKADLELLGSVCAPIDGMVVHGAVEAGKPTTASRVKTKLQPRGKISPDEVVMTVLERHPGVLYLKLKEKDLRHLREGMAGVAKLEGTVDGHAGVVLSELQMVSGVEGEYFGVAQMQGAVPRELLWPGRSAKVVFQVFYDPEALVLPAKVVHERIRAGQLEEVVYQPGVDGGRATASVVRSGPRDGDRVVIVSGLEAGTKVLVAKP
jgi:multidrug resistance efflux pump